MACNKNFDLHWCDFKTGSKEAFGRIYHEHVNVLLRYGYKIHSNRSFVEDCVQDLFVELWNNRTNLSQTTSVKYYLFKALRYKILRKINQESKIELVTVDNYEDLSHEYTESNLDSDVQSLQMSHLTLTINSLPARQKEAINLRFYHNFSHEEVAQIMGVNYKSACRFIYMGIKKLKANLKISVA